MMVRYEDMRVDRLLIQEYQKQLASDLHKARGLNDIDSLLSEFEEVFAGYIGTKHALALNSGTDALQIALKISGVGKRDSVLIPDVTYPAVGLAVRYAGAEPILVDVSKGNLQIEPKLLQEKIKSNTKAIVAVHMFGKPSPIENILKIARKRGLSVIEDVCQAESSGYKGKKLGSFADISCFSFSYYKPLSSCGGGGGMLCFNDKKFKIALDYTKVWKDDAVLSDAGKRFARMYLLDLVAIKVKFKYLDQIIKSRLRIKKIYEEALAGLKGVGIFRDGLQERSVPQNFVIFSRKRDPLGVFLTQRGILWQKPYQPLHKNANFKRYAYGPFPNSELYWAQALHLPLFSFMKEEEAVYVVSSIKEFLC